MKRKRNKPNLVILDKNFPNNITTELKELKAFCNATFRRITDKGVGLPETSEDSEIVQKAQQIYSSKIYESVTVMTSDKGRDGDDTFRKAHKDIGIIRTGYKEIIQKLKSSKIRNLSSLSGWFCKIFPDRTEKTKYAKYESMQQTHVKKSKCKSRFTYDN